MYGRLFVGAFSEGTELWYQLTSPTNTLEGDPLEWSTVGSQTSPNRYQLAISHRGSNTYFFTGSPHVRALVSETKLKQFVVDLDNEATIKPSELGVFTSTSKRFIETRTFEFRPRFAHLDFETRHFKLLWERFELVGSRYWDTPDVIEVECKGVPGSVDDFELSISYLGLMQPPNRAHAVITEEMTYIDDIVAHRHRLREEEKAKREAEAKRQAAERERQAEAKRQAAERERQAAGRQSFAEKSDSARQAISLKGRQLTSRDKLRLSKDLCLACGSPVWIQRNNQFGHVFFGCSQWSPRDSERHCKGARPATCSSCHNEMHEDPNPPGVNVLRCDNFPECPGSREIPERLEINRWLATRKINVAEIRDEFKKRGLL